MTEPVAPLKRVVLLSRDGLHRIVGTFDPSIHTARDFIEFDIVRNGQIEKTAASLIQVQPRFVLYREIMVPSTSAFNEHFHPRQS